MVDGRQVHVVVAEDLAAQAHLPEQPTIGKTVAFGSGHSGRFALYERHATRGALGIAATAMEHIHAAIFQRKNETLSIGRLDSAAVVEGDGGHQSCSP